MTRIASAFALTLFAIILTRSAPAAVYHVDQSHPKAIDTNAGTEEAPFKTISAAVAKVQPGDTVYVKNGTYREEVRRVLEGDKWSQETVRMTLAAAPGHRPVVKGSEVVTAKFEPVRVALREPAKGERREEFDPDAWRKQVGLDGARQAQSAPVVAPPGQKQQREAQFVGIYVCPWETYSSVVFADNSPLKQVGLVGSPQRAEKGEGFRFVKQYNGRDVADLKPGTFFYDAPNKKLYVWLADSGDPNKHVIEAGVRGGGLVLHGTWTVNGLDVMHCQDNFQAGCTAVAVIGRRAIVENCRILHNQFFGLILNGFDGVLRGCEIGYSGVCGISNSLGWRMRIEKNEFHHNDELGGMLCCHSGDKITQYKDLKVLGNYFHDTPGIWCDINVNNTLIAENTFENCAVGVYFEISRWGVIVNNVFRNCGRGVWSYGSDVLIANNVFDGCAEGVTISGYPRGACYQQSHYDHEGSGGGVNACLMAVRNNLVVNNIIVDSPGSYVACTKDDAYNFANYSDYNAFVWTMPKIHKGGNHMKFMAGWDDYYARLSFWRMLRHYDENSLLCDPLLRASMDDAPAWHLAERDVVGDARFADRANGDYRLRKDSPLRGKGIAVPMTLNSAYAASKDYEVACRSLAMTGIATPAGKGRALKGKVWGQEFYRIQPLPQVQRLVDLDEQGPADPGINLVWRATGKYPQFRTDIPVQTVPDDFWVVAPENRLKNGDFSKSLVNDMQLVDAQKKPLGDEWQVTAGKVELWEGRPLARPTTADPAAPATAAQQLGPIQPNTEYLLVADMKVDGHKGGYTTTGRFFLAAGKELAPIKSVEVKTVGDRARHWNTLVVHYKSGPDAKADPFVGKVLHVAFTAVAEGPKTPKAADPVGTVQWDNFQLLTGEPLPKK